LVTETVPPSLLVRANAWLEVSVVMSVVLGIALGGLWWAGRKQWGPLHLCTNFCQACSCAPTPGTRAPWSGAFTWRPASSMPSSST
jgi:hypothetical protein